MLSDAIKDEILQSHALAYRRNTLGLAVAFTIVQDLGGWIDCASEPDRGTTMSVYLPRPMN